MGNNVGQGTLETRVSGIHPWRILLVAAALVGSLMLVAHVAVGACNPKRSIPHNFGAVVNKAELSTYGTLQGSLGSLGSHSMGGKAEVSAGSKLSYESASGASADIGVKGAVGGTLESSLSSDYVGGKAEWHAGPSASAAVKSAGGKSVEVGVDPSKGTEFSGGFGTNDDGIHVAKATIAGEGAEFGMDDDGNVRYGASGSIPGFGPGVSGRVSGVPAASLPLGLAGGAVYDSLPSSRSVYHSTKSVYDSLPSASSFFN